MATRDPLEATRHATRCVCHGCGVRVFVYSVAPEDGSQRCPVCTHRANGVTVCWCGRPLKTSRCGGLVHMDGKKYGHAPTPENLNATYLREKPWERK